MLGRIPKRIANGGKYSKKYFNKKGELKHIRFLKNWDLSSVLHQKYKKSKKEADQIASFLTPMLDFDPGTTAILQICRASAC